MLEQLFVVVSITSLVMVTPGPDMILVLRNTLVDGRRAGLQTSLGILCGNLFHITYCLLGIGLVISRSILAFSTLKYAAAGYLVYLGLATIRASSDSLLTRDIEAGRQLKRSFVQGFTNNLLNPKGTLFYLGIFTTVITPETSPGTMVFLVSAMMLVSASFWICFVYTLGRRTLRKLIERSQQAVSRVVGGLLILLGLRLASTSR
jgi:RhtB (resistance to homoserine/threonine) family protein